MLTVLRKMQRANASTESTHCTTEKSQDAAASSSARADVNHLARLSPAFASTVDLLLCVNDGKTAVELPAHRTVLSGHSPVMCDLLHSLKPNGTQDEKDSSNSLRVPMVGDTLLEVQTLLDMVYSSFAAAPQRPVEHQLMAITVAHKYGMTQLVADMEVKLISRIESACTAEHKRWSNDGDWKSDLGCTLAVAFAAAGNKCNLKNMMAHSEAYIVQHFQDFQFRQVIENKLSSHSLFRIARGLAKCQALHERDRLSELTQVTKDTETILVRGKHVRGFVAACPRSSCWGNVVIIKLGKRTRQMQCTNSKCGWPPVHKHKDPLSHAKHLKILLAVWQ